jgi:hypothetical protein
MQFVGQQFTSGNKRSRLVWLSGGALLLLAGSTSPVSANVTIVQEDFTDSTAYGWTVGGTGVRCLTAIGSSPPGSIPHCASNTDPWYGDEAN